MDFPFSRCSGSLMLAWNVINRAYGETCEIRVAGTRKCIAEGNTGWRGLIFAVDTPCKSGLLDDAAARVIREGRDTPLSLLPRLPVTLVMVARHPRAPGLLVLQRVVTRSLPEALEKTFLLRRVAALRTWKQKRRPCQKIRSRFLTCCIKMLFQYSSIEFYLLFVLGIRRFAQNWYLQRYFQREILLRTLRSLKY